MIRRLRRPPTPVAAETTAIPEYDDPDEIGAPEEVGFVGATKAGFASGADAMGGVVDMAKIMALPARSRRRHCWSWASAHQPPRTNRR